jgi:transcriptional regulator with XRE-family HTH domain
MGGTDSAKTARQVELGDRIRAQRMNLGWSQDDLALESGIHRTYIASLETGRRNPSLEVLARLAVALDVDLGVLLQGLQKKAGRG